MRLKWYGYVICGVLILIGLLCTMNLFEVFSVSSKEFGTAVTIETKNDYEEVSKFDLGSLVLSTEDYTNYKLVTRKEPAEFNGNDNHYMILFNGKPLSNIEVSSGKISGEVCFSFYDLNGELITTAKMDVLIEYYASGTTLTLTSVNVNDSIAYLTAYTNVNGAVFKVVKKV